MIIKGTFPHCKNEMMSTQNIGFYAVMCFASGDRLRKPKIRPQERISGRDPREGGFLFKNHGLDPGSAPPETRERHIRYTGMPNAVSTIPANDSTGVSTKLLTRMPPAATMNTTGTQG